MHLPNTSLQRKTAWFCLALQTFSLLSLPVASASQKLLFQSQGATYILQEGETLESVANKFALNIDEIKKVNAPDSWEHPIEDIHAGESLQLPLATQAHQKNTVDEDAQFNYVTGIASDAGQLLSSRDRQQSLLSRGASYAGQTLENWLERSGGKARVKLNLDKNLSGEGNEFDYLYPWYDTPELMTFSQTGIRHIDHRSTLNLGAGQRHFSGDSMLGYNAFFDYDMTRYHYRLGLGAEYARDYLRLAANGYYGLSGWREAPELEDYKAKPANGFDLQAQYWLPSLPQVGGKVGFEQYFGQEVGLFGHDQRQRNPFAVTAGIDYTPFPLFTVSATHKQGASGNNDTGLSLNLNYQFGSSWQQQIDPDNVNANRLLANRRVDLVERNNQIVLQYKKMEVLTLALPTSLEGMSGETVTLTPRIFARHGLASLELDDSALLAAGGKAVLHGQSWAIILPAFRPGTENSYPLSAVAIDKNGNRSGRATTTLYVHMTTTPTITSIIVKDGAVANGVETNQATLLFVDAAGQPLAGQQVTLDIGAAKLVNATGFSQGKGQVETDSQGQVSLQLTHTQAGPSDIRASLMDSTHKATVNFVADIATAGVSTITALKNDALADGQDSDEIEVLVKDREDNPVANQSVSFTVPGGASLLADHADTDSNGIARAKVSSTQAQHFTVTAEANHSSKTLDVSFVANNQTVQIDPVKVLHENALADGADMNAVEVLVHDKMGNPLPGQTVSFSATNGATLINAQAKTSDKGMVSTQLVSKKAGASTVTVSVNGVSQAGDVHFIADSKTASVSTITALKNDALADGQDQDDVEVLVQDKAGNPVANQTVSFTAPGATLLSDHADTDGNGVAAVGVTSTQAQRYTVTAEANHSSKTIDVSFVANSQTAQIDPIRVLNDNAVADGQDAITVEILVHDKNGNPLVGQNVIFGASNGATPTNSEARTGDKGMVSTQLVSKKAGASTVTVSVNGVSQAGDVHFIADSKTASVSTITALNNDALADGQDSDEIEVLVKDGEDNPVANQSVSFTVPGGATLLADHADTDSNGIARAKVSSTQAQHFTVTAETNHSSKTIDISFVANNQTAQLTTITVGTNDALADGSHENHVSLTVTDAKGNPLEGQMVTFTASNGAHIAPGKSSDSLGFIDTPLTSTTAGESHVTATINGHAQAATVNFTADKNSATFRAHSLTMKVDGSPADNIQHNIAQVTVVDAHDNPIPGMEVTFSAMAPVQPTTFKAHTDDKGIASMPHTSSASGKYAVIASLGSQSATVQSTFIISYASAQITQVTPDKSRLVADDSQTVTYKAKVENANGNALTSVPVRWRTSFNSLSETMSKTDTNGITSVTLRGKSAGTARVEAQVYGGSASPWVPATAVEFQAGPVDASHSILLLNPQSVLNNGTEKSNLRIVLHDRYDNPVIVSASGVRVSHDASATGMTVGPVTQNSTPGEYHATVSGTEAGTHTLTVTPPAGDALSVPVVLVMPDVHVTSVQAPHPDKTAATANGSDAIVWTTRVEDNKGLPLPGTDVRWSTSLGDLSAAVTKTNGAGEAHVTLTSRLPGTVTVTAKAGDATAAGTSVTMKPGAMDATHSTLTLTPADILANGTDKATLLIQLRDAGNNPLDTLEGDIEVTNDAVAGAGPQPAITVSSVSASGGGNYQVSIHGTQWGKVRLGVSVKGVKLTSQPELTLRPDASTTRLKGIITVTPTGAHTVGDWLKYCATVETSGGQLAGKGIPVTWQASPGSRLKATFVETNADSKSCAEMTRDASGTGHATARIAGTDTAGPDATFAASAADESLSSLRIDKPTVTADGQDSATVTVRLKDALGNNVPGMEGAVRLVRKAGPANATIEAPRETASGVYQIKVSGKTAGALTLGTTLNGAAFKASETLHTTLVANVATATLRDLTVTPAAHKIIANGIDEASYQVTVRDANDNPLPQLSVTWHAPEGGNYIPATLSDANGVAKQTLTTTKAGDYTMSASIAGANDLTAPVVTAVPGAVDLTQSTFTSDKTQIGADGQEVATLSAHLVDDKGNPVSGQKITLIANNTGMVFTPTEMHDAGEGNYSATVHSTHRGNYTISASVGGHALTHKVSLEVGPINPVLSFANKTQTAVWTRSFDDSQQVENVPQGITQLWSSNNPLVATVDEHTGKVTLLRAGEAEIFVSTVADAQFNPATASYRLVVKRARPDLKFNAEGMTMRWGETQPALPQYSFGNADAQGMLTPTWSSNNPDVATTNGSGALPVKPGGVAVITVHTDETGQFEASSAHWSLDYRKANVAVTFKHALMEIKESDAQQNVKEIQAPEGMAGIDSKAELVWNSGAPGTLTITPEGVIRTKAAGEAQVTLKIKGNDYYEESGGSYTVGIYGKPAFSMTTTARDFSGEKTSPTAWKPFRPTDNITVTVSSASTDQYRIAESTVVELMDSNGDSALKQKPIANGEGTVSFEPEASMVGKTLYVRVTATSSKGGGNEQKSAEFASEVPSLNEVTPDYGATFRATRKHVSVTVHNAPPESFYPVTTTVHYHWGTVCSDNSHQEGSSDTPEMDAPNMCLDDIDEDSWYQNYMEATSDVNYAGRTYHLYARVGWTNGGAYSGSALFIK